jgi:hypothetical protein
MSAKSNVIQPNSNWHRLLHLLDRNGGTLYLAQLYKSKSKGDGKFYSPDHPIVTDGMPKMTEYKLALASASMRYERQAERMGWVMVQKWNNRTWVTLLPKGRSVLKALAEGKMWSKRI